jgi:N-acetylmuramoyl-L-alanine amidase
MGVKTAWNQATQTVTLTQGKTVLKLVIGSMTIAANGKSSKMEVAPLIRDGRTYLPAAYVAQAFGYAVSWDDQSKTMTIKKGSS